MNTRTGEDDAAPARAYELRCEDCDFATTVEGDVFDVLDVVDAHQEEHVADRFEHFVEFKTDGADWQAADSGD